VRRSGAQSPFLQALLTGFTNSWQNIDAVHVLSTSGTGPVPYQAPSPTVIVPAHPYTYVELLFEQPKGFEIPKSMESVVTGRYGFNITEFMEEAGLDDPVRANFFYVEV